MKDRIQADIKSAMLSKDNFKRDALRMVLSEIKNAEIEKKEALSEPESIKILERILKQRLSSFEQFKAAGREDLATQEEKEAELLRTYLPKPLSKEEVEALVIQAIAKVGRESGMGVVMNALREKTSGRADGKLLADLVRKHLASN